MTLYEITVNCEKWENPRTYHFLTEKEANIFGEKFDNSSDVKAVEYS